MYNFIDVNEASEGVVLPSEALKINGEYIENLIPGYRTLTVSGREALSPDVESFTTGVRDGSRIKRKKYPERIIIVEYQLIAATNEEFREAYNQLGKILNVEDAELIFNDEQDKFFVGTPCIIGAVKPGTNSVVGEFEILCTDPFKYSVIEYEVEAAQDTASFLIDYGGTYKSYPILEADFYKEEETSEDGETVTELTGNSDCGYVAFFTEGEKIIQLGDPDELDGEVAYPKSQTLFNSTFNKKTSWGSAAKSQWSVNSGVTSSSAVEQAGSIAMQAASYSTVDTRKEYAYSNTTTVLTATSTASRPLFNYEVDIQLISRYETYANVAVCVTVSLGNDESYFGNGYGLIAMIRLNNGVRNNIRIKDTSDYWSGKKKRSFVINTIAEGLTATATKITGIKFSVDRTDTLGTAGTLDEIACADFAIPAYSTPNTPQSYYLAPSSFGTGNNWHGPSITRTIPADAAGDVGATNFTLTYSHKMSIDSASSSQSQYGAFQVLLVNDSGSVVAGVNVYKGSSGRKAKLRFYFNGSVANTMDIDLSYGNKYFTSGKTSTITKSGNTVTFNIGGIKKTFRSADVKDMAVKKITFTMSKFGDKPQLAYNGLYWAKFVKNNCDTWKDIPNKFSTGDVVEADCKNGEIYLNGVPTPSLGALGNDWEDFVLTPGLNQIGIAYSEWVQAEYAPTMRVRYREVFL